MSYCHIVILSYYCHILLSCPVLASPVFRPACSSWSRGRRCTGPPTSGRWPPAPSSTPTVTHSQPLNVASYIFPSSTSDHLPHVGGGWLGRVDAPGLLTLGHAPPELVVLVQDGGLGLLAQLPQGGAGRAGGRGALGYRDIVSVYI